MKGNQNQNNRKKVNFRIKNYRQKEKKDLKDGNLQDAFVDNIKIKSSDKFPRSKAIGRNDPKWYYKSPQILQDVASFSYARPLGNYVKDLNTHRDLYQDAAYTSIPGLLAEALLPIPGISEDESSPLNIAAQNVYSFVRYKNSGAKNYDAPDLMLYFLAMDQVYMAWNWAKRIYGMASTYSQMNKYMPEAWFAANCVSMEDVLGNLADFRAALNLLANKISAYAVPGVFNYMVRHSWLFSNVYIDSETRKAQQYMFIPAGFYKYSETTSPNGGELLFMNVCGQKPNNPYTTKQIIGMITTMVDALTYSEDIGVMSGDVIKAYGEGNLFRISEIEPDYRVEPVYRREVLSQIENSYFTPFGELFSQENAASLKIWQDPNTNFIKFRPEFKLVNPGGIHGGQGGMYLNFHWDNPTPEDVMEATRLNVSFISRYDTDNPANATITITDCATEIAIRAEMFWMAQKDTPGYIYDPFKPMKLQSVQMDTLRLAYVSSNAATLAKNILKLYLWCAFDWAPQLRFVNEFQQPETTEAITAGNWLQQLPLRDWDVYTLLTEDNVAAINQLALLSMFDVPN